MPLKLASFHEVSFHHRKTARELALDGRPLGRPRDLPARWVEKLISNLGTSLSHKPTASQRRWDFCFTVLGSLPTKPSHMRTEDITRLPEAASRRVPNTPSTPTRDPLALLACIYRETGLPMEAARRCAQADFQCSFPRLLKARL